MYPAFSKNFRMWCVRVVPVPMRLAIWRVVIAGFSETMRHTARISSRLAANVSCSPLKIWMRSVTSPPLVSKS